MREEPELKTRWPRIEARGKEAIAAVRGPLQFLLYSRALTGFLFAAAVLAAVLYEKAEAWSILARWCPIC
jgi:hypothetical protein